MVAPKDPSKIGVTRVCVGCGAEYVAKRYDQRSCGQRSCAREAMKLGKFKGESLIPLPKELLPLRPCKECGVEFQPTKVNHNFCSRKCNQISGMRQYKQRPDFEAKRKEHNTRYRVKMGPDVFNEKARTDRARQRYAKFGATPEDYERLFVAQEGKCAVCGTAPKGIHWHDRLVFDHCHSQMVPRELLCQRCNKILSESVTPDILRELATYLERHGGMNAEVADSL